MTNFERKVLKNGKPNPKYVDLLDEDDTLAGQKFACLSFVSPEKILKKRETYLFDHFVKQWDISKSMEKYFEFLHTELCQPHRRFSVSNIILHNRIDYHFEDVCHALKWHVLQRIQCDPSLRCSV